MMGLHYEVAGEGEVVVLLHSGYTDSRLWDDQFEVLSGQFRVIRYDIRGFGKSEKPTSSFSNIEDLKELLKNLGIAKAHLIGISMGGSIAIDFTLEYPDSVESLILSGASLNGYVSKIDEASEQRFQAGMSIIKRDKKFDESIDFLLNSPMWRQSNPSAHNRLKEMFIDTSLKWILEDKLQMLNPNAAQRLSEIKKETLIIVGTEDSQQILEIAGILKSSIAKSRRVNINGTGHLPNLDKPKEFNKIIYDFLKS